MFSRRAALALALAFTASSPLLAAEPFAQPFEQAAFDAAMQQGQPVLVEISAPWCPVCRAQKGILSELLAQDRFAGMLVLEVDFDSRRDIVRTLGAQSQSTLIVYAGGGEVGRSVGDTRRDGIEALLASAL